MPDLSQECEIADCLRPVHSRGRYCAAHAKQQQRGGITHAPVRERMPLRERIGHLCDELANADSDDDAEYNRRWDALRKSIEEWAQALRQSRAGKARMQSLTVEQRSALGRRAVKARSRHVAKERRIAIAAHGGRARAESMQANERTAIARKGANARWDACSPTRLVSKHAPLAPEGNETDAGSGRARKGD